MPNGNIDLSTLAQIMACCLMAPSHYLNQCWLIIKGVQWHSPESDFTGNVQDIFDMILKMTNSRLHWHFPWTNELTPARYSIYHLVGPARGQVLSVLWKIITTIERLYHTNSSSDMCGKIQTFCFIILLHVQCILWCCTQDILFLGTGTGPVRCTTDPVCVQGI